MYIYHFKLETMLKTLDSENNDLVSVA